jgi:L-ascorbate metabolism protein UlaG (beta-lactamase superfamily)
VNILMVGHSTVLIEVQGQKILTDPHFGIEGNRFYERIAPPALRSEACCDVNLVLVSHNHWDHVDRDLFRLLSPEVPILVPGRALWLRTKLRPEAKNVIGLNVWKSQSFGGVRITAVPALHDAIAAGFILETQEGQLYFSGDTYYHSFMKRIGERWKLDVALIPVANAGLPLTMGQRGAVNAIRDLLPKVVIPIHMGMRPRFSFLRTHDTADGFAKKIQEKNLATRVVILREGEVWNNVSTIPEQKLVKGG